MSQIDYDLLAAAMLRIGKMTTAVAGANGDTHLLAGSSNGPTKGEDVQAVGLSGGSGRESEVGSPQSWADAVEEEHRGSSAGGESVSDTGSHSDGSVVMPVRPVAVGEKVKQAVKFGGMGDWFPTPEYAQRDLCSPGKPGYFAAIVRRGEAVRLRERVTELCGAKLPKEARESLAICTFAAGVMPDVVKDGKRRLRTLAAVGDAALTLHLVTHQWAINATVESAQAARSRLTSNKHLNLVMAQTGLLQYVSFPGGVDPVTTTGTATAFEAILGVLVLFRSPDVVRQFLLSVGLLE